MEYKELGRTGEKISTIGMGTWKVGDATRPQERQEELLALRRGLELGINLIDTAEMYGDGKAERLVAETIKGTRDKAFVATKVWPNHLHYDDVILSCNRSLERLGLAQVDLYQVHWPNPKIPISETMRAMEKLVEAGKVRFIGVSNFGVEETKEAKESLKKNELVSNQVEYSLANRSIERSVLPYAEQERMTVIAYSPLARGNIPMRRMPREILDRYHMKPAQAALNWVTRHGSVVAIPKAAKLDHAEENATSVSVRFTPEEYERISLAFEG